GRTHVGAAGQHGHAMRLVDLVQVPVHAQDLRVDHVEVIGPEQDAGVGHEHAVAPLFVQGYAAPFAFLLVHHAGARDGGQGGLDVLASFFGQVPENGQGAVDEDHVVDGGLGVHLLQGA